MFGWMLVKMILGKMMMQKFNENFEKICVFLCVNHLRISLALIGMFTLAATLSFLTGNFVDSALFLIAAMILIF